MTQMLRGSGATSASGSVAAAAACHAVAEAVDTEMNQSAAVAWIAAAGQGGGSAHASAPHHCTDAGLAGASVQAEVVRCWSRPAKFRHQEVEAIQSCSPNY